MAINSGKRELLFFAVKQAHRVLSRENRFLRAPLEHRPTAPLEDRRTALLQHRRTALLGIPSGHIEVAPTYPVLCRYPVHERYTIPVGSERFAKILVGRC
jgi:hypothetical protein